MKKEKNNNTQDYRNTRYHFIPSQASKITLFTHILPPKTCLGGLYINRQR